MKIIASSHNIRLIQTDIDGVGRIADTRKKTIGREIPLLMAFSSARWTEPQDTPTIGEILRYSEVPQ